MEDQGVWEVMEPSEGTSQLGPTEAAVKAKEKKAKAHLL